MENSYSSQDDRDDQILIFIQEFSKSFYESCGSILKKLFFYIFTPVVLIYSFWTYTLEKTWQIIKLVSNEIFEVMKIVLLTLELWYWSTLICLQVLLFYKKFGQATVDVEKEVYRILKEILRILNVFPLSKQNAAALYSFMKRIPIFGEHRLPFPWFLFEQTFTRIQFKKGEISMTVPLPSDLPKPGADPSTQTHTSTLTEDSSGAKPSTLSEDSGEAKPSTLSEDSSEADPEAMTESRRSSTKTNNKSTYGNPSSVAGSSESE